MNMQARSISTAEPAGPLRREPRRFGRWFIGALVVLAAAAAVSWWYLRGPAVKVALVTRGPAAEIVYATGSVEPETWSRLTPLVRGRIVERCRCEGKAVRKGERLARLDDTEALATLNDLRALEVFNRQEFDRQSQLLARGATTTQLHQKAAADLARMQAQVAAQEQRLRYLELVAPMDGIVLREDGEVGDMVDPGTILYRIGLAKPLWLVAEANEEDVPRIAVGQKALLRTDAFVGQVLQGWVKEITPAGDPIAKTFRVRIGLPEDTSLRVGMSVEANIVTRENQNALLVPANALLNREVLVITDGRPKMRGVITGIRGTSHVEVLDGLEEGETVVSPFDAKIARRPHVRILTTAAAKP
ncbi:efflux RND transporter periplasmic adaptor subunit [Bradyrhizobium sp. LMG 9283]|uniref:efflux RND transporter periplasmic adaptor subunit n=1 Tax=Bradyrhizobium sp. LMG 9283 TaxID=592064 RepID=UPI00388E3E3A